MRARERQVRRGVFRWEHQVFDEVVRDVQTAAAGDGPTVDTASGVASVNSEGLYRVEYHGHRVIWVPAEAESVKKRLLVCAHLEGASRCNDDSA